MRPEWNGVYKPSDAIVAREIEGELLVVPLSRGIGDMEDELYSFNETGKAVFQLIDGSSTLRDVVDQLVSTFDGPIAVIEEDVLGLVEELLRRKILVPAPTG